MKNRIKLKRVGDVDIFEIAGDFKGSFASRGKAAIQQAIKSDSHHYLLLNLEEVESVDQVGLEAIMETASLFEKRALMINGSPAKHKLTHCGLNDTFVILKDFREASSFFSEEFVITEEDNQLVDRRGFTRLKTALPLEFSFESEQGVTHSFFAVITNLSEGGLFAEFIESNCESTASTQLNPYDLKLLKLKFNLSEDTVIEVGGKLIHGKIEEGTVGIEFYNMDGQSRERLNEWLLSHSKQGDKQ